MRPCLPPLTAAVAACVLLLASSPTVSAYSGQVAATVQVSGPSGEQACDSVIAVSVVIQDQQGQPVAGQSVAWSIGSGGIDGDTVLETATTTGAKGDATTHVRLACARHGVTIAAMVAGIEGTAVVQSSGGGLPRTDTALLQQPGEFPGVALASLAMLLGSALILRRLASARR